MLARDIAEKMGRKKPVLMEMPLIASLKGKGRMDDFKKMSKSDPESATLRNLLLPSDLILPS